RVATNACFGQSALRAGDVYAQVYICFGWDHRGRCCCDCPLFNGNQHKKFFKSSAACCKMSDDRLALRLQVASGSSIGDQASIGAKEQTRPVAYELFKQARTLARNV